MKNLQKLRANKTKNNENDESSIENIGLFDTLIKTVSGAVVLGVLFYVNSSEFDLHNRSKRALDYFETPERLDDIAPVHLVADNDFDSMHRRKIVIWTISAIFWKVRIWMNLKMKTTRPLSFNRF